MERCCQQINMCLDKHRGFGSPTPFQRNRILYRIFGRIFRIFSQSRRPQHPPPPPLPRCATRLPCRYSELFQERELLLRQQREAEEAAKNASAKLELRKQELVQDIEAQLQALQAAQEEYAGATAELEVCNKAAEQAERRNARIRTEIERIGGDLDPKRQEALRILEGLLKKNEGLEQEKEDVIQVSSSCVTAPFVIADWSGGSRAVACSCEPMQQTRRLSPQPTPTQPNPRGLSKSCNTPPFHPLPIFIPTTPPPPCISYAKVPN